MYLPGGYPELHLKTLGANGATRGTLRAHVCAGKPLFAECGGMLYLLDTLTDRNGTTGTMLGLLPGHAVLHGRLAALGLQSVELGSEMLRGHAFHYSSLQTPLTPYTYARRTNGTAPGEAVYRHGSILASYLHCYFPSSPRATAALFQP